MVSLGPTWVNAELNQNIRITCFTQIESNPAATVTWSGPHGNVISSSDPGYSLICNSTGAYLQIESFSDDQEGLYTCIVRVEGTNVATVNGIVPNLLIGEIPHTVIVARQSKSISLMIVILLNVFRDC